MRGGRGGERREKGYAREREKGSKERREIEGVRIETRRVCEREKGRDEIYTGVREGVRGE